MWGAMPDTSLLHTRNIPILAFHGDADDIVPYDYNYPFGIAGPLKTLLVEPMFGSSCIVDHALKLGRQAHLVTFSGFKHSPHVHPTTKAFNENFFVIQDLMSDFFYDIVVPQKPEIVEEKGRYYVRPYPLETSWQVEGGVILSSQNNAVEVAWIQNAPRRTLTVSVLMPYGVGITETSVY